MSYIDPVTSGQSLRWVRITDSGEHATQIRWENRGWVVETIASDVRAEFAVRANAAWKISQVLLFRDLPEPDLWLGTDGSGRWGEINGAHRPDLDGCLDVEIAFSPVTMSIPIRRLGLADGQAAEVLVAVVDVEFLTVTPERRIYSRVDASHWRIIDEQRDVDLGVEVDEIGFVRHVEGLWRREAVTDT